MNNDYELNELASEFFRIFSRAEYALKVSGFNQGEGDAKPNWDRFADEVDSLINAPDKPELANAINFIISAPPKKQVIINGELDYIVSSPNQGSKAKELFVYIRRIRNNLFHGGKFNKRWLNPERSKPLLEHGLVILKASIHYVSPVDEAYNG